MLFAFLCFLSVVTAFEPFVKEGVAIRGSSAPLKDFDPLGFASKFDVAYLREAELKHGRWGMIAATSIPLLESHGDGVPAIHQFDALDKPLQTLIVGGIAAVEFQTMVRGWKNPVKTPFQLQENYQPGDLGFALVDDHGSHEQSVLKTKELNNGRLAMIAALGMIAQELVTKQSLF